MILDIKETPNGRANVKASECLQSAPEASVTGAYSRTLAQGEPSQDHLFTDLGPS